MAKVGRKPFVVDEGVINRVEAHAATGLTQAQICKAMCISKATYFKNKAENPELKDAYKRGRAKGIGTITNALFQTAKNGNVTAQIFFLKNTSPKTFKDRHEHEHSGKGGGPIRTITTDMTAQEAAEAYADTLKSDNVAGET